jgi:SAM-dependent methyltransferase
MAELNIPRAHSNSWYEQLARVQTGYYYPWTSTVGDRNGEQAFLELLSEYANPAVRVLEVGCGHGELALSIAGKFEHVIAYDRIAEYIALAEQAKTEAGTSNIDLLCYDAADPELHQVTLPAEDDSIDLVICRRGPLHWIEDAIRVCRNGAWLVSLNPMEEPIPAWSSKLPHLLHYENSGRHTGSGSIHQSVENRLHQAGLMLHSGWGFDVPEIFSTPQELYSMITWGLPPADVPPIEDIEYKLDGIFERYAEPDGIALRHCRFLWRAQVHK